MVSRLLPHGRPAILIGEHEPLLMMDAVDILEEAGFGAHEATSAAQAVAIPETAQDIVLVFTEVRISGDTDGSKLARMARDRWPPIGLIVRSGRAGVTAESLPVLSAFLPEPRHAGEVTRVTGQLRRGEAR